MKVAYDAKRYYHNQTGLGNYSRTLVSAMQIQHEDIDAVLYDSKAIERTFSLGRRAAKDGCQFFHGLSNELPRDIIKSGIPSIVTMHDVAWRTFPDMYKPWDRLIYDWKYGWSAKHASHVVCISESTKRDVVNFYNVPEESISVIYQPVQQLFYTPMATEDAEKMIRSSLGDLPPYVLTVGSINSRKNLLGMIQAIEMVPVEERPLFIVVGNGREYRRKVEEYIDAKGLRRWVRIESNIHDGRMLQALYTKALCMMYPSFYEGFGLPVVEASLQRCPVITSNVSSLPEAGGPDCIQVNPQSPQEIATALRRILADEEERRQRGEAAYRYCMEKFRPDTLTQQMYQLYREILR